MRRRRPRFVEKQVARLALAALGVAAIALLQALQPGPAPDPVTTAAYAPSAGTEVLAARAMPPCGSGRRVNCVVDGDTFWLDGEKIRIVNIDAPEIRGHCARENRLAQQATIELSALLTDRAIRLAPEGTDRYGRTLAAVMTDGGDVGAALVERRLAAVWRGRRDPAVWCGG